VQSPVKKREIKKDAIQVINKETVKTSIVMDDQSIDNTIIHAG
jgi:hypothetical protein